MYIHKTFHCSLSEVTHSYFLQTVGDRLRVSSGPIIENNSMPTQSKTNIFKIKNKRQNHKTSDHNTCSIIKLRGRNFSRYNFFSIQN